MVNKITIHQHQSIFLGQIANIRLLWILNK